MARPPVSTAMSSSIALRRSPKPGALTAATCRRAAQLVDHERRERLAFDVLGDDQQRLADASRPASSSGSRSLHRRDLLLVNQDDDGVLEHDFHPLGIGDEVRREIAAIELHAFDDVERRCRIVRLFDRDDAVFADLLHRFGDDAGRSSRRCSPRSSRPGRSCRRSPDFDWATSAATIASTAFSMPRFSSPRVVRRRRRFFASLAIHRLREHGGGRGAVAGDVGRLARDFLDHLRAQVLEPDP